MGPALLQEETRVPGKPAVLGRVKRDNTFLTCNQGNFNLITARNWNQTLVTMVRDMCTTTVPPTFLHNRVVVTNTSVPILKYTN